MHRRAITLAVAVAIFGACGGVDRGGSRDDIVEEMRNQGVEADVECVGHVLDGYTDDELKAINDQLADPSSTDPQTQQFLTALKDCTPPLTAAP